MKIRLLISCSLFLFLVFNYNASSQTASLSSIKEELDAMFLGLDKTKIPTGYLWDTAVNLVDLDNYNGSALTDSNYVSIDVLSDMIRSANSASVGSPTIDADYAISGLIDNSSESSVSVGFLFRPVNYIVANALTDNLISYNNDVVIDSYVNGIWQNPYSEEILFGFAPGLVNEPANSSVTFTLHALDTLSLNTFTNIQFDAGDGNGYQNISLESPIQVHYFNGGGVKELKLKVSYSGINYVSHSAINVKPSVHPQPKYLVSHRAPVIINTHEISTTYQGNTYKAMICYEGESALINPIIVSEGFDPWSFAGIEDGWHNYAGFTNLYNTDLLPNESLIYIDWFDCSADIRANAEVFKAVIRWVNEHKTSNAKTIVIGQSMGGLIARYALRDMELNNETHQVRMFVSHDVPYRGANVSPGLMYLYWDCIDAIHDLGLYSTLQNLIGVELVDGIENLGTYQSVKQMLPLYIGHNTGYSPSEYNTFHSILDERGYPRGDAGETIENVAIVNGGKTKAGLPSIYSSTDEFFHIRSNGDMLFGWLAVLFKNHELSALIPGSSTYKFSYSAYPYLSNNSTIHRATLKITKKLLWLFPKTYVLHDINHKSPAAGVPLDAVSSSLYSFNKHILSGLDTLMFIPTASAFDSNDYYRDFLANHPVPGVDTPFTSYIISDTATFHTSLFPGTDNWLETISASDVVGPDLAFTGDVFRLTGPAYSESHIWSVSDPSIATIDPVTGEITAVGSGLVEVVARLESANSVITKRKTVLVGLPETIIQYDNTGSTYTVYASPVEESVSAYWNDKSLKDSVTYNWSLIKWPSEGAPEVTPFYANDSISFVTDPNIVKIAANVEIISREDTLALFEYILIPDQYIHNLRNISVEEATEEITFIYNLNEIPMTLSNSYDPCIILRNNPAADSEIVPARIEVAGIGFPLFGPYTQNGNEYYIWRLFISPRLPFWEQLPYMTVMQNIRAAEDAILIRIFDEEDNIVQILSVPKYVLHVFPL